MADRRISADGARAEAGAILIRAAGPADAGLLSLVGGATFLDGFHAMIPGADILAHATGPHGAAYYARALADPACAAALAVHRDTDAPVGYMLLTPPDLPVEIGEGDVELKRIYTLSRYHGSGIAGRLYEAAREAATARGMTRMLLGVHEDNARAIAFYRKMGMEIVGERRFTVGTQVYRDVVMAGEV